MNTKTYCKKSGLEFQVVDNWDSDPVESPISINLDVTIHPLFQGENWLKVERYVLDRKECWRLREEVIAAMCMFRLNSFGVISRELDGKELNGFVVSLSQCKELQGRQDRLSNLYKTILENHAGNTASKFRFNLEEIQGDANQLINLIFKCKDIQIGYEKKKAQERELEERRIREEERKIKEREERNRTEREINQMCEELAQTKTQRIMEKYSKELFQDKGKRRVWNGLGRDIAAGGLSSMGEDRKILVCSTVLDKLEGSVTWEEGLIVNRCVNLALDQGDSKSKKGDWDLDLDFGMGG